MENILQPAIPAGHFTNVTKLAETLTGVRAKEENYLGLAEPGSLFMVAMP